jgi:phosphorylcholine metabolism protein LicD
MEKNYSQLIIIKEFLSLCAEKGIKTWLMGGWGLDFLQSKETRSHNDIDFIADKEDYSSISNLVVGFADTIRINTREKIAFYKVGIGFDICFFFEIDCEYFIDLDENDPLVYPMPNNSFPKEKNAILSGIKTRTISWEAQYVAKKGFFHYSKKPLREKDELDLNIIIKNITLPLKDLDKLLPGIEKETLGLASP